jgi:hypothetical protein
MARDLPCASGFKELGSEGVDPGFKELGSEGVDPGFGDGVVQPAISSRLATMTRSRIFFIISPQVLFLWDTRFFGALVKRVADISGTGAEVTFP